MKPFHPQGATPLEPEDFHDLIPTHITTQTQLNEWEMHNIVSAQQWLFARKRNNLLSMQFVKTLHTKMFGNTWRWAGRFRTRQTNIGCDWTRIPTELTILLEDAAYQKTHHSYSLEPWAVRFHHRLVSIHPFFNGNGRHARWMADAWLWNTNGHRFSWGAHTFPHTTLNGQSTARTTYLHALKQADQNEDSSLLRFAMS